MADLIVTISGPAGSLPRRHALDLRVARHPNHCPLSRRSTIPPFTSVVEVGQVVEIRDETGSLIFAGTVDSVEEEIDAEQTAPGQAPRVR